MAKQPRAVFTDNESRELLDLLAVARKAHRDYEQACRSELVTGDAAATKAAMKVDIAADKAVSDWIINRTDYSRTSR